MNPLPMRLLLGIHNHQPVGNFTHVMEQAYQDAYLPFLEALERHPRIRLSMHHSGPLLEFLEIHHPDYLSRIGRLIAEGRVEAVGGAFQEPILPAIPEADRRDQIIRMRQWLREKWQTEAAGMWLAERVWEPQLAGTLQESGVDWVALDDYHLGRAGLDPETVEGYYLTEDEGRVLAVFPISQKLRYLIPFHEPAEVVEHLRERARSQPGVVLTFFDDGEKFGVWPGTHALCYTEGWVERFFTALEEATDVELCLFREVRQTRPPRGRVYLPTASYFEMGGWSLAGPRAHLFADALHQLPTGEAGEILRGFLAGGFWRNFLVKYPEVNLLQKRMMRLSQEIRQVSSIKGESPLLTQARQALHRSQCNCAYWHGVFGGAYLPHLRNALWEALIEGEVWVQRAQGEEAALRSGWVDLEKDGLSVWMVEGTELSATVKPGEGGALLSLDLRPQRFAVLNTFSRRPESYHQDLLPALPPGETEPDIGNIHQLQRRLPQGARLAFDWYRHLAFQDHVFAEETTARCWLDGDTLELSDGVDQPWEVIEEGESGGAFHLELRRNGNVWREGTAFPLRMDKRYSIQAGSSPGIEVRHRLFNPGLATVEGVWAVEWTVKMLTDWEGPRGYRVDGQEHRSPLSSPLLAAWGRSLAVEDDQAGFHLLLETNQDVRWDAGSLRTFSQSESGVDEIYQGTALLAQRRFSLGPGESLEAWHRLTPLLPGNKNP